MKALVIVAIVVALLALIVMFIFASHQTALHNEAANTAATQQQQQQQDAQDAKANTEGTIGPIEVNKSTLYNRDNNALGQSGPGPQSVITGAQVEIPTSTATP